MGFAGKVVIGDRLGLYKPSRPDYSEPEVSLEEVSLGRVIGDPLQWSGRPAEQARVRGFIGEPPYSAREVR
jgi:hypothetical protein